MTLITRGVGDHVPYMIDHLVMVCSLIRCSSKEKKERKVQKEKIFLRPVNTFSLFLLVRSCVLLVLF
jgi:hypothetical protein